jgi:hypothetical protein
MEHYVRPADDPSQPGPTVASRSVPRRLWHWFTHLLDDREPSHRTTNVIVSRHGNVEIISSPDRSKGG